MNNKPFTHDELISLLLGRLPNGLHVVSPWQNPIYAATVAYDENDILPALRNVVGASVFMYYILDGQRKALMTLIERCEEIGGDAEYMTPVYTHMLQAVDMGCRSAIDGITATAALFKPKGEPSV